MRSLLFPALLLLAAACAAAQTATAAHRLTMHQARQIAVLVAKHEHIDLNDTHIEMNSMDLGRAFIPGFVSFIVIRESTSPGPDETLRRYTVNRSTGDVWEINLCTRYDFPELTRMRRAFALPRPASPDDLAAEGRELGCTDTKTASTL
jgi:Effector immunity protein Tgi2PP